MAKGSRLGSYAEREQVPEKLYRGLNTSLGRSSNESEATATAGCVGESAWD